MCWLTRQQLWGLIQECPTGHLTYCTSIYIFVYCPVWRMKALFISTYINSYQIISSEAKTAIIKHASIHGINSVCQCPAKVLADTANYSWPTHLTVLLYCCWGFLNQMGKQMICFTLLFLSLCSSPHSDCRSCSNIKAIFIGGS